MTNERPNVSPASRYCESEAARLLGVNRRTIARWRESGHIRPMLGMGVKSGRIYYKGTEIVRVWVTH
jgi:predicted site-specific integrase-resolvase